METDLTIQEVVNDPIIGMVLKADRVPQAAFAQLLESAARLRRMELEAAASGHDVSSSYATRRTALYCA